MSKRENPHLNCKMQNRGVFGLTSTTGFCIMHAMRKTQEKFFDRDSKLAQLEGVWSKAGRFAWSRSSARGRLDVKS